ncbi:MAG TPA: M48 family metalloprotease [Candidatus Acidoferrum sp.]|nr:M48 family metalloprotease [Candidatus Acidoferrum sp.]
MYSFKFLAVALVLIAMPLAATAQQLTSPNEVVDKIVAQEQTAVQLLRQYTPLVETYIQYLRANSEAGAVPNGDKYFLGRAELARGVGLEPLDRPLGVNNQLFGGLKEFFTTEFVPRGFLQMIYVDMNGLDRSHYRFEYIRREFLGEVRCLVFDIDPLPKAGKGRFVGRIWVEDQDYQIVRFNGAYGGPSLVSNYFNFDSWRINVTKNLWLPAFIYAEEGSVNDKRTRNIRYKAFRAQTRLWGYNLGHGRQEQELGKVLVEAPTGITDQSEAANDYSPLQSERSWDRQAEDNIAERLEQQGLLAPPGEVDNVLQTVINNIEVTNGLDIQPEIRCRILMTSTLESFAMGHTIVLSRGLIDVLPDETSLAAILAHEIGHVVLGHRIDSQFGFFDNFHVKEKETFRHFDFARTPEEERAASQKAIELLKNSPYNNYESAVQLFLQALKNRSKQIPNLISPNLGNRVPASWILPSAEFSTEPDRKTPASVIAALPLGGRIKIDPWSDELRMLKSKSVGPIAESEKMPFQITHFLFYLTRQGDSPLPEPSGAVAAKVPGDTKP